MNRFYRVIILTILIVSCIAGCICYKYFQATPFPVNQSFKKWYSSFSHARTFRQEKPKVYEYIYLSPVMKIDKVYRSMEGPYSSGIISLASIFQKIEHLFNRRELYWLTGYSVEVIDAQNGKVLSEEWMCHNNLNTVSKEKVPWTVETIGSNIRLFTLTEGQTKLKLPDGFGIPVLSDQKIEIISQVLNHNVNNPDINVKQRITIEYIKDDELNKPMTALYQQSVFITKLISGPSGDYDELNDTINAAINVKDSPISSTACCSIEKNNIGYNPYKDNYGREFTGHWVFQPGREILKTNVTRMLNLKYDTKAHYISVHVHPFCESLELIDITENKSLFKANVINSKNKIGLEHIDTYETVEGILFYRSHKYELVSTYNNPTQQPHTAMATMFLYLEDKN